MTAMHSPSEATALVEPYPTRIELGPRSYVEWLHVDAASCARRAVAYVRLSVQTSTNRDNLETQLADSQRLADANGCTIVAVVVEYGEKAFDREKIEDRPGMVELLSLVQSGDVDAVIAFQQERAFRDDLELALFKRYARKSNVTLFSKNGSVEPNDPTGDAMSTILGALGKWDSAIKRNRAYAKHEQLAERGAVATRGGIRPFGYDDDRMTPNPVEALVIETAFDDFLNSVSLREIARRWNAAGTLTPSAVKADGTKRGGNQWTPTTVRQVLRSHRVTGLRLHRRTGEVHAAAWPSIVDRGKWERVQQLLDDPSRRTNERKRAYMLSGGLLRCGVCDSVLVSRPYGRQSVRRYICAKDRGGCGGVFVNADHVEKRANEVVRTFLAEGSMPGVARFSIVTESNELADVQASLARAQSMAVRGLLDEKAFEREQRALLAQERKLRAAVVRAQIPEWLTNRGETAKQWDSLDAEKRRAVIAYCVDYFVIERRDGRSGAHFDESRVVEQWSDRTK